MCHGRAGLNGFCSGCASGRRSLAAGCQFLCRVRGTTKRQARTPAVAALPVPGRAGCYSNLQAQALPRRRHGQTARVPAPSVPCWGCATRHPPHRPPRSSGGCSAPPLTGWSTVALRQRVRNQRQSPSAGSGTGQVLRQRCARTRSWEPAHCPRHPACDTTRAHGSACGCPLHALAAPRRRCVAATARPFALQRLRQDLVQTASAALMPAGCVQGSIPRACARPLAMHRFVLAWRTACPGVRYSQQDAPWPCHAVQPEPPISEGSVPCWSDPARQRQARRVSAAKGGQWLPGGQRQSGGQRPQHHADRVPALHARPHGALARPHGERRQPSPAVPPARR